MTSVPGWDGLRERARRAAELDASPWVMALALALGAVLADLVLRALPRTGSDLEQARQLGIVSQTVLRGHPKSVDVRGYVVGLAVAVGVALALWLWWAHQASRGRGSGASGPPRSAAPAEASVPRWHALEWVLVPLAIALGFFKLDMARNGFNPWVFLSEEGEMMAWVDALLRGQVLSRDVYCLYGPLAVYPVAGLFKLFGPSLWVWRVWLFALNVPALLVVYVLLRGLTRTRTGAALGTLLAALLCTSLVPAMSWSLSRVTLGLAAIATLHVFLRAGRTRWLFATGALLGVSLFFSQEVGLSSAVAVVVTLVVAMWQARPAPGWARALGWLAAGAAAVVAPLFVLFAAQGALGATLENLFVFPRVRMLGYAAYVFPSFDEGLARLLTAADAAGREGFATVMRAYFAPVAYAGSAFVLVLRAVRAPRPTFGGFPPRALTLGAILVFGLLLFQSALSRPDLPHLLFALPPALVLLVALGEEAVRIAIAPRAAPAWRAAGLAFLVAWLAGLAAFRDTLALNLRDYLHQTGLTLSGRFSTAYVPGFRAIELPRAGAVRAPAAWAQDLEGVVRYAQAHTRPDQAVWAFPNDVMVNFLADRPLSNRYPLGIWGITREQRNDMVDEIRRSRPPCAVFYLDALVVDSLRHSIALPELLDYVRSDYVLDGQIGRWLVLRPKETAS
jgi:hypothetical protein